MSEQELPTFKVCVVGAQGSGKSAIVYRFIEGKFRYEDHPTLEDRWEKEYTLEDKTNCKIMILDTGGSEETFNSLHKTWFEESDGFVIVYNIASKFTFGKLWSFIRGIDKIKPNAPRIIIASQNDKSKQREVTVKEGSKIAQQLGCDFLETSAKTGENVDKIFDKLLKQMRAMKEDGAKMTKEVSQQLPKARNPSSPSFSRKRAGSALPLHLTPDALDEDSWTTPKEPKRNWGEIENPSAQVTNLFKQEKASSIGFHFELGKTGVPYNNASEIEDESEDLPYYQDLFYSKEHLNLVSETESGFVIISVEPPLKGSTRKAIIRTKKGNERLMIPATHSASKKLMLDFIKTVRPDIGDPKNFEKSEDLQDDLLNYEAKELTSRERIKLGVLLYHDGQDENAMFSNSQTSNDMEEFLEFLATKIELRGFSQYAGGLDTKTNTTGTHSYFTQFHSVEIMFHVSTMLPFQENDTQRVERKRHLGNDIILLIFKDSKEPFDPTILTSHFNHVFIVIEVAEKTNDCVKYRVGVANKAGVEPYGPFLNDPAIYENNDEFRVLLLSKIVNAERWCLKGGEFRATNIRTRKETLETLIKEAETKPKKKKQPKESKDLKERMASPTPGRPELSPGMPLDGAITGSASSFRMPASPALTKLQEQEKRNRSLSSGSPTPKLKKDAVTNVASSREFSQEKIDKIILCARTLANASQVEPAKFESNEFRDKLYQLVSNTVATFTGTDSQLENIIGLAKSLSDTGSNIITLQEKRKDPAIIESTEPQWKATQSEFGNKLVTFIRAINATVSAPEPVSASPTEKKPEVKEVVTKIEKPVEAIGKTTLEIASLLSRADFDADEFGKHMRLIYDAVKEIASTCEDSKSRLLLDTVKPLLQKAVQLKNESENFVNRKVFIAELTKLCAIVKDVKMGS